MEETTRCYKALTREGPIAEARHLVECASSRVACGPALAVGRCDEMDRTPPSAVDDANGVGRFNS